MAKYIYPAIFTKEKDGSYLINFPDLDGCYSQGEDLHDAYDMAADVLCLMLYHMEETNELIPSASNPKDISVDKDSFIALVSVDTLEYRMFYENKSIKKTLTLPQWLNTIAEREGVNFSYELQSALKTKLGITDSLQP